MNSKLTVDTISACKHFHYILEFESSFLIYFLRGFIQFYCEHSLICDLTEIFQWKSHEKMRSENVFHFFIVLFRKKPKIWASRTEYPLDIIVSEVKLLIWILEPTIEIYVQAKFTSYQYIVEKNRFSLNLSM